MRARLIELDRNNVAVAQRAASAAGLTGVEVVCGDAGSTDASRSRRAPDLTPAIRGWLADAGFREESFDAPADALFSVGMHRFAGAAQPLVAGRRLFRFVA